MIRNIEPRDHARCLEIYNHYIENTNITFEIEPLTLEALSQRFDAIQASYPFLVYEEDGRVLGYAYLDIFHPRAAYRFSVDLSIYLDKDYRGRGAGKKLLDALEKKALEAGYVNIISLVTSENVKSMAFHEKNGYKEVGDMPRVGYKFDRWVGIKYYMKRLGE